MRDITMNKENSKDLDSLNRVRTRKNNRKKKDEPSKSRRKKSSWCLPRCKNKTTRWKVQESTRKMMPIQKTYEESSVPETSSNDDNNLYEYQNEYLREVLQQPLNHFTLTQDELTTLFVKYKSDGHYRTNENLSLFDSFPDNTHTGNNGTDAWYSMQYPYIPSSHGCRSNRNVLTHSYYGSNESNNREENSNTHNDTRQDTNYDSWSVNNEVLKSSNIDNIHNRQYTNGSPTSIESFACNLLNTNHINGNEKQNSEYKNKTYFHSMLNTNTFFEDLNTVAYPQSNVQSLPLNSTFNGNIFETNKWDISNLSRENNNFPNIPYSLSTQASSSAESYASYSNNMESYFDECSVNNSGGANQSTNALINRDYDEKPNDFNFYIDTNLYPMTSKEDMYVCDKNLEMQYVTHTFPYKSADNFILETDAVISSTASISRDYA